MFDSFTEPFNCTTTTDAKTANAEFTWWWWGRSRQQCSTAHTSLVQFSQGTCCWWSDRDAVSTYRYSRIHTLAPSITTMSVHFQLQTTATAILTEWTSHVSEATFYNSCNAYFSQGIQHQQILVVVLIPVSSAVHFWVNHFGTGRGVPKILGMLGPVPYGWGHGWPIGNILLPTCYHSTFGHPRSNHLSIILEICRKLLTPHAPPFKVIQSHWNREESIGHLWLRISVP